MTVAILSTAPVAADNAAATQLTLTRFTLINQALTGLVASPHPIAVFASLADLCVLNFSERCTVELHADDGSIEHLIGSAAPRTTDTNTPDADQIPKISGPAPVEGMAAVRTDFDFAATAIHPAVRGTVIHGWTTRAGDDLDTALAAMAVERAADLVERERLADAARQARGQAEHLQLALQSNRHIGAAIGILMASYRITEEEAFGRLRNVSQNAHIKLRDLADEVIRTGCLT